MSSTRPLRTTVMRLLAMSAPFSQRRLVDTWRPGEENAFDRNHELEQHDTHDRQDQQRTLCRLVPALAIAIPMPGLAPTSNRPASGGRELACSLLVPMQKPLVS